MRWGPSPALKEVYPLEAAWAWQTPGPVPPQSSSWTRRAYLGNSERRAWEALWGGTRGQQSEHPSNSGTLVTKPGVWHSFGVPSGAVSVQVRSGSPPGTYRAGPVSQDWVQRLAYSRGFLGIAGGFHPVLCHCIWGLLSERGSPGTVCPGTCSGARLGAAMCRSQAEHPGCILFPPSASFDLKQQQLFNKLTGKEEYASRSHSSLSPVRRSSHNSASPQGEPSHPGRHRASAVPGGC